MFQLHIDDRVLIALSAEFSKPHNSAAKALDKYKAHMHKLLFAARVRGQTNQQRLLGLYSIPLRELSQRGPTIGTGSKKIRLHKWLVENGFELMHSVHMGSNLNGEVSQVRLTKFVFMQDPFDSAANSLNVCRSDIGIDAFLCSLQPDAEQILENIYSSLTQALETNSIFEVDYSPIDVSSLKQYLLWLEHEADFISPHEKAHMKWQAMLMLVAGVYGNGYLLQHRKTSPFGRTYYHGISVQSINKVMRSAMLGYCWEYDIQSSVTTWKMGYAKQFLATQNQNAKVEKEFGMTIAYLADKRDFMSIVQRETFSTDSQLSNEFQHKLIKRAMTALSFGARLKAKGWQRSDGTWENPAIVDIIKIPQARERFINCYYVKRFIAEQNLLDDYLAHLCKEQFAHELASIEGNKGAKLNNAQLVALMYQHGEAQVMQVVRSTLAQQKKAPIALIHDAFIVRDKLGFELLEEIHWAMRDATGNSCWRLGETAIEGFDERRDLATLTQTQRSNYQNKREAKHQY